MNKISFPFLVVLLCLLCGSCAIKEKPVTRAEAEETAKTIMASALNENPELLNHFLDVDALCDKMEKVSGISIRQAEKASFATGFNKRKIGNEIFQGFEKGTIFRLVRQYERKGKQHLLFRIYYGSGGINYFDFTLVHAGDKIKAEDLFIYTAGEPLSVIASRLFKDVEGKKYSVDDISEGNKIRSLVSQASYAEAFSAYQDLPPAVRKQKTFMQLKIEIASNMEDSELYIRTLEEYKSMFPDDTNIPLLMIDAYFLKADYEKALLSVNQLNQLVKDDPFLNYYRALCYKKMGNMEQYTAVLEKLYQYEPEFQDGNIELIAAYLKRKDQPKAREIIKAYRSRKQFDQELLTTYLKSADGVTRDMLSE